MSESEPLCRNCRFGRRVYGELDYTCHHNPPAGDRGFPVVRPNDWCGQHEPAQPVKPPPTPIPGRP